MTRSLIITAGISGLAAVGLGAFAAHGLKPRLSEYSLDIWSTAVQYHFIHTLAMLGMGLSISRRECSALRQAGWFFLAGIILFSGSLYLLALRDVFPSLQSFSLLGPITPIGGLCFLAGWAMVVLAGLKKNGEWRTKD